MNSSMPIPGGVPAGSSRPLVDERSAAQVPAETPKQDGFDRHFDAARRQGGRKDGDGAAPSPSPASASDARKTSAPRDDAASSSKPSDAAGKGNDKPDDKTDKHADGQSPVAAMLGLFGAARQSMPQDVASGSAGSGRLGHSGPAGATATATADAAWLMSVAGSAASGAATGAVDAAAQTVADAAAAGSAAGDGAKTTQGGLIAVLAATTMQAAGSMAHAVGAVGAGSLAPRQDNQSSIDGMAVNGFAAGMAQGGASPPHALNIAAPAGSASFAQELGQQVVWLGGQTMKQANIRLNPERLGSLDVKVSVTHDGHVDVSFTAQHPSAVTAVQQSLGQLDLMLAGQGLSLGQAQVGQQGAGHQDDTSGRRDAAANEADAAIAPLASTVGHAISVGLLDTFA